MPKFQWDHPMLPTGAAVPFPTKEIERTVTVASDPYEVLLSHPTRPTTVASTYVAHKAASPAASPATMGVSWTSCMRS